MFALLIFLPEKDVDHRLRLALYVSLLLAEHAGVENLVESGQRNFTEPRLGALPGSRRLLQN
jgi:hypothetical protein